MKIFLKEGFLVILAPIPRTTKKMPNSKSMGTPQIARFEHAHFRASLNADISASE